MTPDPSSPAFFEAKYLASGDPWNFVASPYENDRYERTIDALSHRHYGRAFEPGCSVGALTLRLAALCDEVFAIDSSPSAVKSAQARCRIRPNVHVTQGSLPEAIPARPLDLTVFSEIGYYFAIPDLDRLLQKLVNKLRQGGTFLAVHWLGNSADHRLSGDEVHDRIHRLPQLEHKLAFRYEGTSTERYRLDRWVLR